MSETPGSAQAGVPSRRWVRSEEVLWRRLPDAVVILPVPDGDPLALEGTGALLWDLLAQPIALEDAAAALAAVHGIESRIAARDIHSLLDELARLGFARAVR